MTFAAFSAACFAVWPLEKADYSMCKDTQLCAGSYSSRIFGGADYVLNINDYENVMPDAATIKHRYIDEGKIVNIFSPIPVLGASLAVGLGAAVISAVISNRLYKMRAKN